MYATIRRWQMNGGDLGEVLHLVDTVLAKRLEQMDGFMGYECLDCGDGLIASVSTFRDREAAEASIDMAAEFVRDHIEGRFDYERLEPIVGEVAVSRAREGMLEPAHH